MLTLSLDEYGDFEGLNNTNKPIYIAGIIFDDCDIDGENGLEKKRIEAYYRSVISEALNNDAYPQALHSNGNRDRDRDVVRPVKKVVSDTLPEFLRKGTYRGKALTYKNSVGKLSTYNNRQGKYHAFVFLKSDRGMTKLLNKNTNIFAKDNYASNLYFHMADETVSRLIFYNPVISNIKNVTFNIASRTSANIDKNSIRAIQYKKQGYKPVKKDDKDNEDTSVYYSLTNGDVYRTAIAKEILDSGRTNLGIADFHVYSISYNPGAKNMEYLYLADSICSILGYNLSGDSADIWIKEIAKRVENLNPGADNLVFGYDEIDLAFSKAWEKFQVGDYYEALAISFDSTKQSGAFVDHYRDNWFPLLANRIIESKSISAFDNAVRKLNESLHYNYLDQEKCLYILDALKAMIPNIEKGLRIPEAKRILYMYYDTAISAYCHIGDSRTAIQCFEKCTEYGGTVGLDTYLQTSNKMVVNYCDFFETDEARKLADENVSNQQLLSDVRKETRFCNKDNSGYVALGKAYSQRGQVYAFQRDSRAEDDFRQALDNYEKGSADYKITQSYLLHFYLDTGNMDQYRKEATDYFGGRDKLIDQLDYILVEGSKKDPLINMKYSLYVLVKSINSFRLSEVTGKVWDRLQCVEKIFGEKIRKKDWILTGHPSELIFKYMRLKERLDPNWTSK